MNPSAPPVPPVSSAPAASIPQQTPSPYLGPDGSAGPPAAPRKSAAKPAHLLQQESQQSIEDIEDSFQDTTTSPHQKKLLPHTNQPQPLLLKRSRDEVTTTTGSAKTNDQQEVNFHTVFLSVTSINAFYFYVLHAEPRSHRGGAEPQPR